MGEGQAMSDTLYLAAWRVHLLLDRETEQLRVEVSGAAARDQELAQAVALLIEVWFKRDWARAKK